MPRQETLDRMRSARRGADRHGSVTVPAANPAHGSQNAKTPAEELTRVARVLADPICMRWDVSLRNFEFLGELGRGSFGIVHLARYRTSGLQVAIKVLKLNGLAVRKRFAREADLLEAYIGIPNVVNVLDADVTGPTPYIVLEYCAGGSLDRWIAARRGVSDVCWALAEAAAGLAGIHAQGGIHRDVKPLNLLVVLDATGTRMTAVKVTDFGVARQPRPGRSMTRSAQGTIAYMAPEIRAGAPFLASADVYSLGITAVELLTGSQNPAAILSAPIPEDLRLLVRRMLAGIASERPGAAEVCDRLLAVRRALVVAPPVMRQPVPSVGNRQSGLADAIGFAALVGLFALGGAAIASALDDNG